METSKEALVPAGRGDVVVGDNPTSGENPQLAVAGMPPSRAETWEPPAPPTPIPFGASYGPPGSGPTQAPMPAAAPAKATASHHAPLAVRIAGAAFWGAARSTVRG